MAVNWRPNLLIWVNFLTASAVDTPSCNRIYFATVYWISLEQVQENFYFVYVVYSKCQLDDFLYRTQYTVNTKGCT